MSTTLVKPAEVERKWYLLDAAGKSLGHVAAEAAVLLRGKQKVNYTPNVDCGDYVVVINCDQAVLTGKKAEQKFHITHSKYIGGLKKVQYSKLMAEHSDLAMTYAIKGMVPSNTIGDKALHQQGEAGVSMNQPGRTLGGAVRQLAEKMAAGQDWTESSVLRRFNALATADSMPEVSHHLRGMIQLLRREEIPLDYPQLAEDLYQYQFVDGAPNVRLRWGRDLYASPTEKTKENEKEN